jgi:TPR repeat protein
MPKIRLFIATLAVVLIAAQASSSAAEPVTQPESSLAALRAYLQSGEWEKHREPCFTDRPAGWAAEMRGLAVWIEYFEYRKTTDTGEEAKTAGDIATEMTALIGSARMNQMIDDFELGANHGCGAVQAMMALFYRAGFGRIRANRIEALKWIMLAEKSGYIPAQYVQEIFMLDYSAEEIAKARAMADDWHPSD